MCGRASCWGLLLTGDKLFQFLSGTCRVIGRRAPDRKEKLTACEYNILWLMGLHHLLVYFYDGAVAGILFF